MASALQSGNTNLVIGGNFDTNPWQRGTTFTGIASGTRNADNFVWSQVGTGVVDILKTADAPTVAQAGIFTQNCLNVDVTTADAAIAAGDSYVVYCPMEGYDFAQIAQSTFTLSFWHKHTITGTYCVGFINGGADRSYVAEYTQTTTNTWEYSSITVTASPSAGTWNYTTGVGLYLFFTIAAGATFQTPANVWTAGYFYATGNQVNGLSANTNFSKFQLVQVRAGSQAQPWQMRSEAQELALCQRYYWKSFLPGTAPAQNAGTNTGELIFIPTKVGALANIGASIPLPVKMRAAPTLTTYNPSAANAQIRDATAAGDFTGTSTGTQNSVGTFYIGGTGNAGTAIGNTCLVHITAEAGLT